MLDDFKYSYYITSNLLPYVAVKLLHNDWWFQDCYVYTWACKWKLQNFHDFHLKEFSGLLFTSLKSSWCMTCMNQGFVLSKVFQCWHIFRSQLIRHDKQIGVKLNLQEYGRHKKKNNSRHLTEFCCTSTEPVCQPKHKILCFRNIFSEYIRRNKNIAKEYSRAFFELQNFVLASWSNSLL